MGVTSIAQWQHSRMTRGCAFSAMKLSSPLGVIASVITGRTLGASSGGASSLSTAWMSARVICESRAPSSAPCRMAALSRLSAAADCMQTRARREQTA